MLAEANRRSAKIAMGRIGDAAWCSQSRKTASPVIPASAMARTAGAEQPTAGGSMNAKVTPDTSKTTAAAPGESVVPPACGMVAGKLDGASSLAC